MMSIELGIEGGIPVSPVGETLQVTTSERCKGTLFRGHAFSLKAMNDSGEFSIGEVVSELIKGGTILSSGETGPRHRLEGTDASKIVHTKVKRGGAIVEGSFAFRSKNESDGGGERILLQQKGDLRFNFRQGEDRNTIHRDNVGAEMLTAKSTEPSIKGRAMDGTDIGTTEASARVKGEAQW
jgi:hypothetical protein